MEPLNKERLIQGDGTPESVWKSWAQGADLPVLPLGSWTAPRARVVVVSPHPDDEVLACGALLSEHAHNGGACLVVAVTDGEASHPGSAQWPPERLAVARRAESVEGLARLGLDKVSTSRLGLPDGQVARHFQPLVDRLMGTLLAGDIVVSTWRLDGHPDHEASGQAAALVCGIVGCRFIEAPVWMWHWAMPQDPRVPWARMHCLPVSSEMRVRKGHALAAHATQLAERDHGEGPVLGATIRARAERPAEYFFV